MDYILITRRARALIGSSTPDNVAVTIRVDSIAQEPDETLTLRLSPVVSGPMGDSIFFRDTITLTIIDSDSEYNNLMIVLYMHTVLLLIIWP